MENMEEEKRKIDLGKKNNEIIYSKSIKAGNRIYYLDVKKSRRDELYLAITESKKKKVGFDENAQVTYEKHKIFLYREDFDKFREGLEDVMNFIKNQGEEETKTESNLEEDQKSNEISDDPGEDDSVSDELDKEGNNPKPEKNFFDKFKF